MNVLMVRSRVKQECTGEVEGAVKAVFAAMEKAQLRGVRYTSLRLGDGLTYVVMLQLDEGVDNPLPGLPEFQRFQAGLQQWLAEPPTPEQAQVVGSYGVFD